MRDRVYNIQVPASELDLVLGFSVSMLNSCKGNKAKYVIRFSKGQD